MSPLRPLSTLVCFSLLASLHAACGGALESSPTSASSGASTFVDGQLRPAGAACAFDGQCETQRCSVDWSSGACGVCVAERAPGEPCDQPRVACSRSSACTAGVCRTSRGDVGSPCTILPKGNSSDCDEALQCVPDGSTAPDTNFDKGTCQKRPALGEPCSHGLVQCARGGQCVDGTCAAFLVNGAAGPGERCDRRVCGAGLFCLHDGACHPGTLRPGDNCADHIGDDECIEGSSCELDSLMATDGVTYPMVCTANVGEGAPCASPTSRAQCAKGLRCAMQGTEGGVCSALQGAEAECSSPKDCADGLECRAGHCKTACR